jgi:hypothetical protein
VNFGSTPAGINLYAIGSSVGQPVMFRDKDLGLFYVGDGGFLSEEAKQYRSQTIEPFWINSNGMPMAKPSYGVNGGGAGVQNVYNSYIFANMMYWAIDYSEFHGPHKAKGDYTFWLNRTY